MGRPCTICFHPQRDAINQALAAGHSYRDVAGYYVLSKTTLHRHWQAHVAAETVGAPVAQVEASGRARSSVVKWWLWAAAIAGMVFLAGRAGNSDFG